MDLIFAFCAGALGGVMVTRVDQLRSRGHREPRHLDEADGVLVPDAMFDHFERVAAERGQPEMGPLMARKWQALDAAQRVTSRRRGRRGWRRWTS